jgi:hypothetical protein
MVLLYPVVEILDLADDDSRVVFLIISPDGRRIGLAAIDGDLLRHAMTADRLGEKALGRLLITLLRQEEIDGLPGLIHCTIQVIPLAFDLDIRLVQMPADPDRPLVAMERRFQLGTVLQDPAVDRRVVDGHPPFLHQLFNMAVAQGIGHVPPDARQDNVLHKVGTLEADHHRSPSLDSDCVTEEDHTPDVLHLKICDKAAQSAFAQAPPAQRLGWLSHLLGALQGREVDLGGL